VNTSNTSVDATDVPVDSRDEPSGESTTATPAEPATNTAEGFRAAGFSDIATELRMSLPELSKDVAVKAKKLHERQTEERLELLKEHPELVARFVKTILPVLVDVYAASVAVRVRTKVLMGLVKAVAFTDADSLKVTLRVSLQ
jgi:E3 ubiquitin-protein ligase TRIP12